MRIRSIAALATLVATALLASACGTTTANTAESEIVHDKDPNATAKVTPWDLKGAAPDDAEVKGTFQLAFGWTDKYGRNALVIGKTESTAGDATTSMLVAQMILWEGDSWTVQRTFRERIEGCQFDTELMAIKGAWSVTDLDGDGRGEATFAWRAGCRSDVSPVTHKVLVARSNSAGKIDKYVLRGTTRVDSGAGVVVGGEFKADPTFDSAPKGFLAHAKMVWGKTATEVMK